MKIGQLITTAVAGIFIGWALSFLGSMNSAKDQSETRITSEIKPPAHEATKKEDVLVERNLSLGEALSNIDSVVRTSDFKDMDRYDLSAQCGVDGIELGDNGVEIEPRRHCTFKDGNVVVKVSRKNIVVTVETHNGPIGVLGYVRQYPDEVRWRYSDEAMDIIPRKILDLRDRLRNNGAMTMEEKLKAEEEAAVRKDEENRRALKEALGTGSDSPPDHIAE